MSTISNLSSNLLNLLSSDNSTNSNSSSSIVSSSSTDSLTNSNIDTYRSSQASLADYMSDSSSDSLYSVWL